MPTKSGTMVYLRAAGIVCSEALCVDLKTEMCRTLISALSLCLPLIFVIATATIIVIVYDCLSSSLKPIISVSTMPSGSHHLF